MGDGEYDADYEFESDLEADIGYDEYDYYQSGNDARLETDVTVDAESDQDEKDICRELTDFDSGEMETDEKPKQDRFGGAR